MFSSRFALAVPSFFWRGRWFWGAWLLIFLLPFTREEARLHFVGSRYFADLYGQPWQERWHVEEDVATPRLSPLERAVWLRVREQGFSYYSSSGNNNPESTDAGRLYRKFPREKWLHALALQQSLGWGAVNVGKNEVFLSWERKGEKLDAQNAFYPLVLAKAMGDSGRKKERAAALERAARCTRYDDGTTKLKQVALKAALNAGVDTWTEKWHVWSRTGNDWYATTNQLNALLAQFSALSQADIRTVQKKKSPVALRSAIRRSNALMRVALLFQQAPCASDKWSIGAQWVRTAWRVARGPKTYWAGPEPTAAEFVAFARAQGRVADVQLAQKCAARMRLLASVARPSTGGGLPSSALFSAGEGFWAEAGGPLGFVVLGFGAYLLGWWWFLSLMGWRAIGHASMRRERVTPAAVVIGWTLASFGAVCLMILITIQAQASGRVGPPGGQDEVAAGFAIFSFLAPPLLLALWCAVRAVRRHREVLALPARAQLEMNLAPVDAFMLGRATGGFVMCVFALAVGLSLLWGYLRWQGLVGYDWLRFLWPRVSTRVVDPIFTSLESPVVPAYCAVGAMAIALVWLVSWRYGTDPVRRPIYHDALRGWKEAVGCALTLTVWVYMTLLVCCHFGGEVFSQRLQVAAQRGEGAFVRGF